MDEILIIIAILAIPVFIIGAIIGLFVQVSGLKKRVKELEFGFVGKKARNEFREKPKEKVVPNYEIKTAKAKENIEPGALDSFSENFINLLIWLKTDWIMKLGALLILLAITWFVRYAFLNDWIGEIGRVALGLFLGTGVIGGGYLLLKKKPIPAQVLVVLGSCIILLTTWAARNVYELFDPFTAMLFMALVILLMAVISITQYSKALAILALLVGAFIPILTESTSSYLLLTVYLLLLNIGAFAVVAIHGWRTLPLLSLLTTAFYVADPGIFDVLPQGTGWVFMAVFYLLFLIGSSVTVLVSKKVKYSDFIITVLITLFSIFLVSEYIPTHLQSIVMVGVTLLSVFVSVISNKMGAPKKIIYLQSSAAIVLLGAATVFEFQAETLAIIYSLEILSIALISTFVMRDTKATSAVSLLHFVPAVMAIDSFQSSNWDYGVVINNHFFVLLVAALSAGITVLFISYLEHKEDGEIKTFFPKTTIIILSSLSIALLFALIWRVMEGLWMDETYAHGAALVVYTILAIASYFIGIQREKFAYRLAGMILIGLVMLRLIFVEIWDMSLVGRTVTFIVIGVLFILTAFMEKKYSKK